MRTERRFPGASREFSEPSALLQQTEAVEAPLRFLGITEASRQASENPPAEVLLPKITSVNDLDL